MITIEKGKWNIENDLVKVICPGCLKGFLTKNTAINKFGISDFRGCLTFYCKFKHSGPFILEKWNPL